MVRLRDNGSLLVKGDNWMKRLWGVIFLGLAITVNN